MRTRLGFMTSFYNCNQKVKEPRLESTDENRKNKGAPYDFFNFSRVQGELIISLGYIW